MPHVDIKQPYGILPKYAHMGPQDVLIWERFIRNNPGRFLSCYYDYYVGQPAEADPEMPREIIQAWYDLTRWKIDVVAEDENFIYCIEVKPNANAHAFGKALAYGILYAKQIRPDKPIICVALTDYKHTTTQEIVDLVNLLFNYIHKSDPVRDEVIHHVSHIELWTPEENGSI